MARTVDDVALLWEVLSGGAVELGGGASLRVVFAPLDALPELEPEVASAYALALEALGGIAASVREADVVPFARFDLPRGAILMSEALEVHRSHGWWPARAGDYTEETRHYLRFAEQNLSPDAVEAARAECRTLAARLVSALDGADVLVTPTAPCVAPTHEEAARPSEGGQPRRPIGMKLTRIPGPVNVAGLAALSVPCVRGDRLRREEPAARRSGA